MQKEYDDRIAEAWHVAWAAPLAFVTIITLISLGVDGVNIITALVNPEY